MLIDTLNKGGKAVLSAEFDPARIVDLIESERITKMLLVPPNLAKSICEDSSASARDTSSVRTVSTGGSSMNCEQIQQIFRAFPNAEVELLYTSTEYSVVLGQTLSRENFSHRPELGKAIGRECFFSRGRVLDESGREIEPGEIGELWGNSPGMMARYIGGEAEAGDAWLQTGDMFRRDPDGLYYFMDRKKDMIKSGGENVYSAEVETCILTNPKVERCAVVGLPDEFFGETVTAAIVVRKGESLTEEEIVSYCKERMAGYKKPRMVFFVDSLPRSSLGKIQKNLLRGMLEEMIRNK